jgi:hypothetical protein
MLRNYCFIQFEEQLEMYQRETQGMYSVKLQQGCELGKFI